VGFSSVFYYPIRYTTSSFILIFFSLLISFSALPGVFYLIIVPLLPFTSRSSSIFRNLTLYKILYLLSSVYMAFFLSTDFCQIWTLVLLLQQDRKSYRRILGSHYLVCNFYLSSLSQNILCSLLTLFWLKGKVFVHTSNGVFLIWLFHSLVATSYPFILLFFLSIWYICLSSRLDMHHLYLF